MISLKHSRKAVARCVKKHSAAQLNLVLFQRLRSTTAMMKMMSRQAIRMTMRRT